MDEELIVKYLTKKFKQALRGAKRRARKKDMGFDLDFNYLRDLHRSQDGKCFYSGLPFDKQDPLGAMSLDRIDSDKGYLKGNVVWCRSGINFLKYTRSYDEMYKVCLKLVTYKPRWNLVKS